MTTTTTLIITFITNEPPDTGTLRDGVQQALDIAHQEGMLTGLEDETIIEGYTVRVQHD